MATACAVAVLSASASAFGQDAKVSTSQPVADPLDQPYVNGSYGFSIRPPAGCTIFREKQVNESDVEIVRFGLPGPQWSLNVRFTTTTRPLDAQTIIDGLTEKLGNPDDPKLARQQVDFKVLRGEPAKIAGRDGVRYTCSFTAQGMGWIRQQAVVHFEDNTYFTLVFITPLANRELVEPLFDQIVDSFKILRDERARERIKKALERGTMLLRQAADGELDISNKLVEDNYVRCLVNGQEIGFVRIREQFLLLGQSNKDDQPRGLQRRGVHVRQWGWLFSPDGSITHLENDMFLALDLSFERWDNRLYVLPSEQADPNPRLQITLENAVRESDQLGVAYLPKPNALEKRDQLMTVEKSYASAEWNLLFPRLVDLTKPELYAFSSYSSDTRGLVLKTLEVKGPTTVLIDGTQMAAFEIEDSEGLLPPASQIYVDASGKVLRVVASPIEMVTTTAKYVNDNYTKKVTEAQDRFKRAMPKTATPQPNAPTGQRTAPGRSPGLAPRQP